MTSSVQKPANRVCKAQIRRFVSTNAIIFARVSSVEQKDNNSLDVQIFKMKEYCVKKNYEVIKQIKLVESSTKGEREHFYEILILSKNKNNQLL